MDHTDPPKGDRYNLSGTSCELYNRFTNILAQHKKDYIKYVVVPTLPVEIQFVYKLYPLEIVGIPKVLLGYYSENCEGHECIPPPPWGNDEEFEKTSARNLRIRNTHEISFTSQYLDPEIRAYFWI